MQSRPNLVPAEQMKRAGRFSKELGTGRISPDTPVRAGTRGTWDVTYTVGPKGIALGGGVIIGSPQYWTSCQLAPDYRRVDGFPAEDHPGVIVTGPEDAHLKVEQCGAHWILARPQARPLKRGEEITMRYQGRCSYIATTTIENYELRAFSISVDADGTGEYVYLDPWPAITILPVPEKMVYIGAPAQTVVGEKYRLTVAVIDEHANRTTDYTGAVRVYLDSGVAGPGETNGAPIAAYTFKTEDKGAHTFEDIVFSKPGIFRLVGKTDDGIGMKDGARVVVHENAPEHRIYFGDIHGKTVLSDGFSTADEYYHYGRDVAGLDFCAVSDHDWAGNQYMEPYRRPLGVVKHGWEINVAKAKEYYQPGRYVTFLGYEWTFVGGHRNVYYLDGEGPVFGCQTPGSTHACQLDALIEGLGRPAIVIPHHPLASLAYCKENLKIQPVIEMYSTWGCSEERGNPNWHFPVHIHVMSYQELLARGFKVGAVAGSDCHLGLPGRPTIHHAQSGLEGHARQGYMVILAKELTREALWEALFKRHAYAVTGVRIVLDFHIKDAMMGDEITVGTTDYTYPIRATVRGTAPIESLELLRCNEVVHRVEGDGKSWDAQFDTADYLNSTGGTAWYYVRVKQVDKMMAWSSPIWVTPAPDATPRIPEPQEHA